MNAASDWRRLQSVAEERRDRMARHLAAAVGERDAAQRKLEMLLGYRREYDARLARSAGQGIDAARLRGYASFLAHLEQAIGQQSDLLAAAQNAASRAEAAWRHEQRQVDSFRVLDQRRRTALAREAGRLEQKLIDEIATRTLSLAARGSDD